MTKRESVALPSLTTFGQWSNTKVTAPRVIKDILFS